MSVAQETAGVGAKRGKEDASTSIVTTNDDGAQGQGIKLQ